MSAALDRLTRRGMLTITANDGNYDLRFKAPGPYQGRSWCTTDESDFWSHCRLGASDWQGEGTDLDALITECEETTRPQHRDVDDLRWAIETRRNARTNGPPLPSYQPWHGWHPGVERWLRTSSHATEYLAGYLRDLEGERTFDAERVARDLARQLPQVPRRMARG